MKLLCTLALACLAVCSAAENLIGNPGFEMNPATGLPKMWTLSKGAVGEIVEGISGKNVLQVSGTEDGKRYWWLQSLNQIVPGHFYRLTGKVKGPAGMQTAVYVECSNPWKTISSGPIVCNGEWQEISLAIEFPKLNRPPYLVLRMTAPGKALFADLTLAKAKRPPENLVKNPDFSRTGKDGTPMHWHLSKGAEGKRAADVSGGKYGLQMTGAGPGKTVHFMQGDIPVKAGTEYQLSVRFKGRKDTLFGAYLETNAPWQTHASPMVKCNGEWQNLKWKFKFTDFRKRPYLVFRLKGAGEVVFCEPEITAEGRTLENGDFSAGAKEWEVESGKIADTKSSYGKVLELTCVTKNASARQSGITVKGGQYYQLRYEVRGGSDRTHRDAQGAVWFRVIPLMNGKAIPGTGAWHDSFDAWQTKTVTFKPEQDGEIDILCEVKAPGCVQFDHIALDTVKEPVPPLELLLNAPFSFRDGVYSSNRGEKTFSGELLNNGVPEAMQLILTFQDREYPLKKHGAAYPFTLDVPSRYGEYPIVVRALDRQEKKIAEITRKFRVNAPAEREVSFRKDHVMLIDGEPFFPLGVWGVDGRKTTAEKAEILADAGFNTARCAADQIDDFASAGLMVLMKVPESLPKFTDSAHFERWDRMYRKGMQKYLKHPSLIGYCNTDEPAWRGVASAPVVEAYEYIRKIDPYRPVMLNEAPRGKIADLRSYAAACDTYGVDIYPVPSPNPHSGLDDKTMTCVGRYADLCREVVRDRKPIWMTLQGFAWGMVTHKKPFVYPAHEQNRFMAYNAVAHGATGLFWWGINCNGYENWDFVRELGKTVREIRAMAPVLVSGTVRPAKLAAANPELNILHKRCNGKNWYIVLNESPKSFNADFKLDRTEKLNVFFENRGIACADGTFSDEFTPYAVHVYSDAAELPAPLKQPATRRMFGKAFSSTDDFKEASWIWFPGKNRIPKHQSYFKCEFELHEMPVKAELFATADDFFRAYINGKAVMEHYHSRDYTEVSVRNIAEFLRTGKNTLLIKAGDGGMAPCGLLYALRITGRDGKVKTLLSDASTLASENKREWVPAEVIGKYGCKPWLFRSKAKPADTESIGAFGFPF